MIIRLLLVLVILLASAFAQGPEFYKFSVDEDRLSGAPDFSFLNHALTPADRIVIRNGHFCRADDGQPVRFFGVNFAFGASFPDPPDAARIAKRLRRLGVNLVRLHHLDTSPDRDPSKADSALTTGPYPTLNPESIAQTAQFSQRSQSRGCLCRFESACRVRVPARSGPRSRHAGRRQTSPAE